MRRTISNRVILFLKKIGIIEWAITYGTASDRPKHVITGMASEMMMNLRSISRMPSRYARSIARFSAQSGPISVTAHAIFVYKTPSAQSCHRNRIGVCSSGTLQQTRANICRSVQLNGFIGTTKCKLTAAVRSQLIPVTIRIIKEQHPASERILLWPWHTTHQY